MALSSSSSFDRRFSMILFLRLFKTTRSERVDNPTFIDEEDIPLVHQDEDDYYDYNTPNTSRVDKTSFMEPDTQEEATSTLSLRQKVKRDSLAHCTDT